MSIPLDGVDRELARLWSASTRKDTHACTLNLVVLCATAEALPRAREVLGRVVIAHPARTITIACHPGAAPGITANAALHGDASRRGEPVGEDISLDVQGAARDWIPRTLVRLRAPDLPVCLWWVGDIPDADTLYDRMVEAADVVLIHSAEMDLRDLRKLWRLAAEAGRSYALCDLNWARLRAWQEFTARFFDDPAARALLPDVRALEVEFTPRTDVLEPVSTQAALYAAWVAVVLGWETASEGRWRPRPDGGSEVTLDAPRGREAVTVRFLPVARPGVDPGALNRVELVTASARFKVARADEDPLVLCWTGEGEGLLVPSQCVRISAPEESRMLSRVLERPERDVLYERALAAAAALVRPVAQRPSERPPAA